MAACPPSLQPFQWGEIGLSQIVRMGQHGVQHNAMWSFSQIKYLLGVALTGIGLGDADLPSPKDL